MFIISSTITPNNSKENTTMSKTKINLTERKRKLNNDRELLHNKKI